MQCQRFTLNSVISRYQNKHFNFWQIYKRRFRNGNTCRSRFTDLLSEQWRAAVNITGKRYGSAAAIEKFESGVEYAVNFFIKLFELINW